MGDLRAALRDQSRSCEALGSPFMAQLCRILADRLSRGTRLADRLFDWTGELGPRGDSVPLRLCGALHALRLSGDARLAAVYPPHKVPDDVLWDAVSAALSDHCDEIDRFVDSPPQTNEVRRACVLIAASRVIAERFPLPIRVSELGASAGLNLNWDRFGLEIEGQTYGPGVPALTLRPDWSGPLPPDTTVTVTEKRGVDLNPVDPVNDRLRLRAYLWPDQPERMTLTEAALSVPRVPVDRADAVDWLAPRLRPVPGQTHLIYTTIAWQYFPPEKQSEGTALIEAAGDAATDDSPLAFLQMETDGGAKGAALTLRLWPGDHHLTLGRADFHGRWVDWTA